MDKEVINNIKSLGIDMINEAKSGHPGIVLGAAPIIYTLYSKHFIYNLNDKNWPNRDRFVLSSGHGSALLYSCLFMSGFDLSIDDLKKFRRISSKTPGHPEYRITPGVEVSTGPLGTGFATSVGMALAAKILKDKTKINNSSLIDYKVYTLCSDGDLMEGITSEAASFAGTMRLNNLIVLYDSNDICLDGATAIVSKENVRKKFKAMGWNTLLVKDGTNVSKISRAISKAKRSNKPTIIEIKTIIGKDSMKEGINTVHGKPLSEEDINQLKQKLDMPDEPFIYSEKAKKYFTTSINDNCKSRYDKWTSNYKNYISKMNEKKEDVLNIIFNKSKEINLLNYDFNLNRNEKESTRITNGKIMNIITCENLIGGSADLFSATNVYIKNGNDVNSSNYDAKNIWFGVREQAMGSILNGLALSNFKPYGSTFLSFSDYLKPSIRLSAMMNLNVNYIFTHDSVLIGQDGPTHQPVEQLASLRSIPNLKVFRPCDGHEIIGYWNYVLNNKYNPTALILSRGDVSLLSTSNPSLVTMGAYIIMKEHFRIDGIIIATGTEVEKAVSIASNLYEKAGIDIRVVSMPCKELFLKQEMSYQAEIIPKSYKRIVLEASSSFGWDRFATDERFLLNINSFGKSGTVDEIENYFDFNEEKLEEKIYLLLKR